MKNIDFAKIDSEFSKKFDHNLPRVETLVLVSDNYSTQTPASSSVLNFIHGVVSNEVKRTENKFGGCKKCHGKGFFVKIKHSDNECNVSLNSNNQYYLLCKNCARGKNITQLIKDVINDKNVICDIDN